MKHAFSRSNARPLLACAAFALVFVAPFAMHSIHAAAAASAQTIELNIDKFAFAPKEITIEPGTRVVWTNHDATPHTVAGSDRTFASKGLDTDDRFEHTFATEGDFGYICTLHPFMAGVVHVRKK